MNMSSGASKSRVGSGAAARKRDRYTMRMNELHPPSIGREAMDAKYMDPLYDRVLALSEHLSNNYGDYTVNEIRTLVSLAAENHAAPVLQKYWDEIDGVVRSDCPEAIDESESSSVLVEVPDLSGNSSEFGCAANDCTVVMVAPDESVSNIDCHGDLSLSVSSVDSDDGEISPVLVTTAVVHQSNVSADAPIRPPRMKSARGALPPFNEAPPSIDLVTEVVTSSCVLANYGFVDRPLARLDSGIPSVGIYDVVGQGTDGRDLVAGVHSGRLVTGDRLNIPGRERNGIKRHEIAAKHFRCLWRFLDREMPCSVRVGRVAVAVATIVMVSVCCYAPFQ